jgi:structural maintenance of chromosome 4
MSGGGGKPRGGKMGTSIKDSISPEVLSSAEHELEMLESKCRGLRQSVNEARCRYQAAEAGCARIELEVEKCNKEVPLPRAFSF